MNTAADRFDAATKPQVKAADPRSAAWVSANAGSGKTRVLTNRVARLLLSGTPPQRILCLTFTNAAASNMQIRLFEHLGEWAMLPDQRLKEKLLDLGEDETRLDDATLNRARTLFARALEAPGGLKIQTVHAFSSALLKRFPLEAGVSPQFKSIDDREAHRLRSDILNELAEANRPTYESVVREVDAASLPEFIEEIAAKRRQFQPQPSSKHIHQLFDCVEGKTPDPKEIVASLLETLDIEMLRELAAALALGTVSDRRAAEKIRQVNTASANDETLHKLAGVFLLGSGAGEPFTPKAAFPTKRTKDGLPANMQSWLEDYKQRVRAARSELIRVGALRKTLLLHEFAGTFLNLYQRRKTDRGLLDFNDLIFKSFDLLNEPDCAQWVLYRLDGGIDHVLIDEAQDVNPVQWRIVREIAAEFTAGRGTRERERTVFAVGDEKQSIYGFQGAAPAEFEEMRRFFRRRYDDAGLGFIETDLNYSFRSSAAVLQVVDRVFADSADPGFAGGTRHLAFKQDLPGRVELWPFVDDQPQDDAAEWDNPTAVATRPKSHMALARAIAFRIRRMLENSELVPHDDGAQPVRAGDILILLRRRSELFHAIIQELKAARLPVAGVDRLKLVEELAFRDLTALLSFVAFPADDLSLAAVLRSPLFGLSEDDLAAFALAHGRGGRLWQALKANRGRHPQTVEMLEDLAEAAGELPAYELLERILTHHRGREKLTARLGSEIGESLDALLLQALAYEEEEAASLIGFLEWIAEEIEVKRQLDQAGDEIRVMTIHGAKGLESPIVFLPDTEHRRVPSSGSIGHAPDGTPLWMVKKELSPPILNEIRERDRQLDEEEYARLLYVALTRAESWLIVCGEGDFREGCWHDQIRTALADCGEMRDFREETGFGLGESEGCRLATGNWPVEAEERAPAATAAAPVPVWARSQPGFPEPAQPQPLSPSNLGGDKAVSSPGDAPGSGDSETGMAFGTRLHLLLEHLPGVPKDKWEEAARSILMFDEPDLGAAEFSEVFNAASKLLQDPDLAYLFDVAGFAEAGITAFLPSLNNSVRGFIDRLLVTDDRVLAVDFKSNRIVPDTPKDIPEGILRQLGAQQEALVILYPGRKVETAVLWTRTAEVMDVPPEICREALSRAGMAA